MIMILDRENYVLVGVFVLLLSIIIELFLLVKLNNLVQMFSLGIRDLLSTYAVAQMVC